jgi:hypothetical protein
LQGIDKKNLRYMILAAFAHSFPEPFATIPPLDVWWNDVSETQVERENRQKKFGGLLKQYLFLLSVREDQALLDAFPKEIGQCLAAILRKPKERLSATGKEFLLSYDRVLGPAFTQKRKAAFYAEVRSLHKQGSSDTSSLDRSIPSAGVTQSNTGTASANPTSDRSSASDVQTELPIWSPSSMSPTEADLEEGMRRVFHGLFTTTSQGNSFDTIGTNAK